MTENEAIKKIRMMPTALFDDEADKAKKMAIQALEKQSMVNEILHELREYSAIGTVEEFKALKEKNEPKKIEKSGYIFKCPVCKAWVQSPQCFCHGCRQALDWQ